MCLVYFLLRIKMSEKTCYQNHKDVILNIAKNYYENGKARLREQERDKCRNLSEEWKKEKERIWKKSRYHNMFEEKKQKPKEYQKRYRKAKKFQPNQ